MWNDLSKILFIYLDEQSLRQEIWELDTSSKSMQIT